MQRICLTDYSNGNLRGIFFTSVQVASLQTRINAATLANAAITVKIKRPGVQNVVTPSGGAFTACDDSGAPGVREYVPAIADLVIGAQTFIFTGAGMEPREVPVLVVYDDPYAPAYFGATIAGTLTATSFSTNVTTTNVNELKDNLIEFLDGPNARQVHPIAGSTAGANTIITLDATHALAATPTAGNKFRLISR